MPRPLRIDYPDAWHHVSNRGAREQVLFADDQDNRLFLDLLGDMSRRFGVEVHAYALLPDQFQLLLRSRQGRLSSAMRDLQQTWSQVVNRRHGWDGPLFRGRFRSRMVFDERHLLTLLAYIHLSPVRAGLSASATEAAWTSHAAYLDATPGPAWLHRDPLLEMAGGLRGFTALLGSIEALPRGLDDELLAGVNAASRNGDATRNGDEVGDSANGPMEPKRDPDHVLEAVQTYTGSTLDRIRSANGSMRSEPARRFAVWALRRETFLSQAEVARLLDMTLRQVQNVEQRLKREPREPILSWMERWSGRVHQG